MRKETIKGKNGYDIPCLCNLTGNEKTVVIISHGFESSKESPTVAALSEILPAFGIGTYAFDFPAHGESPADGEKFRIETCLSDLASVEAHVRKLAPSSQIAYFSSSFGAYINLIYLAAFPHAGAKTFLRCAAIDMPGIMKSSTTAGQYALLESQGFIILNYGYNRPLKVTKEFYSDLESYDLFRLCRKSMADIAMIHGDADRTASLNDAVRFAERFGASLTIVKGADHSFINPGEKERVFDAAIIFFAG